MSKRQPHFALGALLVLLASAALPAAEAPAKPDVQDDVTQGALRVVKKDGQIVECPLKHTDVKAEVAGFIARVRVTQTFHNPTNEKIEAVYVFPLPHEAAVDDMTMVIGERRVVGLIKRRAEARTIYERALSMGQTAALLEQERPNIFTQSVGNIEPGQEIRIEISYVDVLKYDMGAYEFHFPMVVGPRYVPGGPISPTPVPNAELQNKVGPLTPNTDRVPDASRINPPSLKPEFRNGHDVMISMTLNAGVPIQDLKCPNHDAAINKLDDRRATVQLREADKLPNKNFILRYGVVGQKPEMAVLAHTAVQRPDPAGGYFMLMIQPREDERLTKSPPREMVFLCDVSGSMSGEPTAKVIESMKSMLQLCREDKDTVQVVTFANEARQLWPQPVPVNAESIARALRFSENLAGGGGTEMLKGVKLAIDQPIDKDRVRIIVMLTDGYIGNEAEIIEAVGKGCGDQIRFWTVGIGQDPNMFLIDGVARQGGGMGKKLGLKDQAQPLCQEIMTRIQRAQLAKVRIDWGSLKVDQTFPAKIPELWAGRPVIVFGRYAGGGPANLTVSGMVEGEAVSWPLAVNLPVVEPANDVLAKVWARQKIEELMQQTYYQGSPAVEEMVTDLALQYRLMSQYTSFVAVDEKEVAKLLEPARPPRRMMVPVPLPEGTRWEGFFGGEEPPQLDPDDRTLALGDDLMLHGSIVAFDAAPMEASKALAPLGVMGGSGGMAPAASYISARGKKSVAQSGRMRETLSRQAGVSRGGAVNGRRMVVSGNAVATQPASPAPVLRQAVEFHSGEMIMGPYMTDPAAQALAKAAKAESTAAAALQKEGKLAAARAAYARAYMLDTVALNGEDTEGVTATEALEAIEKIHAEQLKLWSTARPELDRRLNLVIRDKSLAEALGMLGMPVEIVPGSIADSEAIAGPARVDYLDLRQATIAQALDWLTQPARLGWRLEGDKVIVASDRRGSEITAWVYDVATMASPSREQVEKAGDWNKRMELLRKEADTFIAAVREHLKGGEQDIAWFSGGKLLVIGDEARHEATAKLLADLANPEAKLAGKAAQLQKIASARAKERAESIRKREDALQAYQVAARHASFSWALLAAAADRKLDLEALTQLQIAWNSPRTAELLKGDNNLAVMRSLWAIRAAANMLPGEKELADLAAKALQTSRPAIARNLDAYEKAKGEDKAPEAGAFLQALYGVMSAGEPAMAERFLKPGKSSSPLAPAAAALLSRADAKALEALVASGLQGDDAIVLAALACRRAGGSTWELFRANAADLLGAQPLPGHVVVLVNRW